MLYLRRGGLVGFVEGGGLLGPGLVDFDEGPGLAGLVAGLVLLGFKSWLGLAWLGLT